VANCARVLSAALVLGAAVLATAGGGAEVESPVVLEVWGRAVVADGTPMEEAHGAAVLDAMHSAVLQCHALVEAEVSVLNMALNEDRVRVRSVGYVESLEVLEAGPAPDEGPAVYRVRARATVRMLEAPGLAEALGTNRPDAWAPVVVLDVVDDLPGGTQEGLRERLAGWLERCGVQVRAVGDVCAAVPVRVTLATVDDESGVLVVARWSVGGVAELAGAAHGVPEASGQWSYRGSGTPPEDWWGALSVHLAADVLRVWAVPRPTRVRFTGVGPELASPVRGAFATARDVRFMSDPSSGDLVVELPLSGNPAAFVAAALGTTGCADRIELAEGGFCELTYREASADTPMQRAGEF
jgi:hypothetical protein